MATRRIAKGNRALPPEPVRSVKPRRRKVRTLPVVAVGHTHFLTESGETGTLEELIDDLPVRASTLFCSLGSSGDFVQKVGATYILRTPKTWEYQLTVKEKEIITPGEFVRVTRSTVPVKYFGWKTEHDGSHYHRIIDPVTFYGQSLGDVWPDGIVVSDDPEALERNNVRRLLLWGVALRNFCAENGFDVRPAQGSVAAQFLTDPRFYPNDRRKVPAKINERARENLPGNHYYLNVVPNESNNFTAYYLDQKRSHHYHARITPLPDSNHCYAFGRFLDLEPCDWMQINPDFSGLYCLDLNCPTVRPPFDWVGTGIAERISDHLEKQFVYSNELPHLLDCGYTVQSVRAAWGSTQRDTGLPAYASWCEKTLDDYGDPAWLKPILLATYGVLATRPTQREAVFRLAKKTGKSVMVRTGRSQMHGFYVQSARKLEPGVAYVLQRGLIEAACRSDSIGLSQWLDHLGHKVLSIYADGVIVEANDDNPLPSLPEPWRCKQTLNHLQFINQQAFISDGMTKLPGVGKDAQPYRQSTKPGYAPRRKQRDLITGKRVTTNRRI